MKFSITNIYRDITASDVTKPFSSFSLGELMTSNLCVYRKVSKNYAIILYAPWEAPHVYVKIDQNSLFSETKYQPAQDI